MFCQTQSSQAFCRFFRAADESALDGDISDEPNPNAENRKESVTKLVRILKGEAVLGVEERDGFEVDLATEAEDGWIETCSLGE